jgi:hypothetical protein
MSIAKADKTATDSKPVAQMKRIYLDFIPDDAPLQPEIGELPGGEFERAVYRLRAF